MNARWIVLVGALVGCGANAVGRPAVSPVATTSARLPQSEDEGLRDQGYTPVTLARTSRSMTSNLGTTPQAVGNQIRLTENAGWKAQPTRFARKGNTIFIVSGQPTTIVDRHVAGGCSHFAGGRGWFEDVVYELPPGTTYGGIVKIAFENHVEITDYSDTQPDGSPCPPPAVD